MMIASAFLPASIAVPFGMALFVGLKRLVSRPYELDCDRRAARAIGFRETAAALAKIHAVHPIRNSGLLSLLVYATATHPSREIRLAALRDAAPVTDRPDIDLSEPRIRWQRPRHIRRFRRLAGDALWRHHHRHQEASGRVVGDTLLDLGPDACDARPPRAAESVGPQPKPHGKSPHVETRTNRRPPRGDTGPAAFVE